MIHLDSNAAIALLNERPPRARARYEEARGSGVSFALSIVVYHELMVGAAASERRRANEEKIARFIGAGGFALLPLDDEDAREAADVRAHLRRTGGPIGPYDVFIAAQARRRAATLVTANTREFERVRGLMVVDWARSAA